MNNDAIYTKNCAYVKVFTLLPSCANPPELAIFEALIGATSFCHSVCGILFF